jgi:hypothetical protein
MEEKTVKAAQPTPKLLLPMLMFVVLPFLFVGSALAASAAAITLNATQLTFTAVATGRQPSPQVLTISGPSGITFPFQASVTGETWLSVSPAAGAVPGAVSVVVKTTGLATGRHTGQITVKASDGSSAQATVILNLATPTLSVSPTSLTFSAAAGSNAQILQTIGVAANPTTPFSVAVTGPAWLKVNPSTANTFSTVSVTANIAGVLAGTYKANLAVSGNGLSANIPVTITVSSAGGPFRIIGWNDLGMHCFDGKDYSVFGVLPPTTPSTPISSTPGAPSSPRTPATSSPIRSGPARSRRRHYHLPGRQQD